MGTKPKQTEVEGGSVYAVPNTSHDRPGSVLGWIRRMPDGWRPYGYEKPTVLRPTPEEAIDDLIAIDSEEQHTATWPGRC